MNRNCFWPICLCAFFAAEAYSQNSNISSDDGEVRMVYYMLGNVIRIKIWGKGIPSENSVRAGLDFPFGINNVIDSSKNQLPLVGKVEGLGEQLEFLDSQLDELKSLRHIFEKTLKDRLGDVIEQKLSKVTDIEFRKLIEKVLKGTQKEFEEQAFDVLLPRQQKGFKAFYFRKAYQRSPLNCLSSHGDAKDLKMKKLQLSKVAVAEEKSFEEFARVKMNAEREAKELKVKALSKLRKILTEKQAETLESLLGRNIDEVPPFDIEKYLDVHIPEKKRTQARINAFNKMATDGNRDETQRNSNHDQ